MTDPCFPENRNDERDLLWANLGKLPTYTRLRTAVITDYSIAECDESRESRTQERLVDVSMLNDLERQRLVEKAFDTNEEDNMILVNNLRDRLDRVRYENPTVEVKFQNLSVNADVYAGKRALPSLPNYMRNKIEACLAALKILPSQQYDFPVLDNVSGLVRPGRMTLLLGPPGSGKTTLLLALAGKLDKSLKTRGEITYNGHKFSDFVVQRTSAYVSQTDNHIGDLTVRETLDFAARCQGVGCSYAELAKELDKREREMKVRPDVVIDAFIKAIAVEGKRNISTDYMLKVLGLDICADTKVGSEMERGVSGGQKKRVTTGEMVVGPKKTLFMDEISTGLDSSTTYQIVRCIGNFVRILDGTVLMALLQPAPETFELFDDIMLLSEGQIVYQGPRERVLEFFGSLGFVLPPRKGIADFLQEVTSRKDQEQYWADKTKDYQFVPISKMVEAFNQSEFGRDIAAYLSTPYDKSTTHPRALAQTKYALPSMELLKACAQRELVLIYRRWFLYVFRTCQVGFVAFITSTLFLRTRLSPTDENNGNLYLSSLFFSLVHMMFNGFSEMPILIERLPIFYKQRDNNFYPAWAFSIPSWILRIPYSIVEAIIWSCVVYYTVGLDPDTGRFFRYMLLLFIIHQMAIGLFRLIGSLARTMIVANTFGTFGLLLMFLLGGFVLSKGDIGPWWIWAYWISPLSYAQNAISVNEFLAPRWNKTSPSGHGTLASNVLEAHGLFRRGYWYWIGIGVLIGYTFLFNFLGTLALSYLNPLGKPQAMIPEDVLKEKIVHRSGENSSSLVKGDLGKGETYQQQAYQESVPNKFNVLERKEQNAPQAGMILPFQPLAMTFYNINYYVDVPKEINIEGMERNRLRLLCDVSGVFRPGVLTALVGVSGAGKTTLMDVLAGRKTGGYIEGQIKISGYPKVQETFARISGYVEQTDIHSPQVTVEESLVYSSWLRLPRDVDKETREAFVNEVMNLVELDSLRHALVGLPGSAGLSTEQRKRLTIAVELVANPSIIFMDEPTSGLDARAAAIVMRTVRNTVDTGRTVVCTIHQPSIDIFEAFDELLLMKRGGQVIYGGPLGQNSQQMIDYFQAIPEVPAIKDGYNPATWMLEISTQAAEQRIGQDFATIYKDSDLYKRTEALIQELSIPAPGLKQLSFPTQFAQSIFTQFHACYWKQNVSYWRNPHYNVVRIFFTTICAFIFGSVFWDRGSKRDTVQDVFNVMGALFSAVLFVGVNNASSVQPVVSVERTVYYREKATGMYAPFPYALAQGLVEIPYILVQTVIYGSITYFMINFDKTAEKFFLYLLFMFLTFTYCTFYGMMAIGLTPSQQLAAVVSSAFYSIWNLLSGFLIPKPKIPGWWIWFYYICPFAWTLNGIISSQLGDVESELNDANFKGSVKDFIKSYLGYHHDQIGVCAGILVAFSVVFFSVFAISMKILNFQRR